jgi:hypothetical protein
VSGPILVLNSPGSERTACQEGMSNKSPEPLAGRLGAPAQRRQWVVTHQAVHYRVADPAQYGKIGAATKCAKGGSKPDNWRRMPGAGLNRQQSGKAPSGKPAFQPYWGKPAVRNEREDHGNVGIIRSPVRALILPSLRSRSINLPHSSPRPLPNQRKPSLGEQYSRFRAT